MQDKRNNNELTAASEEAREVDSNPSRVVDGKTPLGGWLTGAQIVEAVRSGLITIDPFDLASVNPNSYNYKLGSSLDRLVTAEIDLHGTEEYERVSIGPEGLVLLPDECYLGHTLEVFGSDYFASLITGRSSIGRKFVTNHITAGLIDVGFIGQVTLEITVQRPTRVYSEVPFGQIFWFTLFGSPLPLYDGKYQKQHGPTSSRMKLDVPR